MSLDFTKGGGEWNVSVARGDDISIVWTVVEEADPDDIDFEWGDAVVTGEVVGATGDWSVSELVDGTLTISLSDAFTQANGSQTYEQYLRVVKDGVTSTWLAGRLTIRPTSEPAPPTPTPRTIKVATIHAGTIRLTGCTGAGGGGGDGDEAGFVEVTEIEYDDLTDDGVTLYVIGLTSGDSGDVSGFVEVTEAEYDALADDDDILYVIVLA